MTWPLDYLLLIALVAAHFLAIYQARREARNKGREEGYAAGVLAGIDAAAKLQRKLREQAEAEQHSTGLPKIETPEQAHKLADNIDRQRGRGELQ